MEIFLKILVIIVIVFILYISFSTSRVKEGLTNASDSTSGTTTTSNSTTSTTNGLAGNASTYASNISSQVTKLNDALLISKYNSDYVNVVNELQDYINAQALETILNISPTDLANNDISTTLQTLNSFNGAQSSLSNILKYLSAN